MKTNIKTKNIFLSFALFTALSVTTLTAAASYDESSEERAIYAQELQEAQADKAVKKQTVNKRVKAPKQKYAGWYMRTKVSATATNGKVYNHDSAGVFGKLVQSKYKKDKHDIPGYGSAIFQVVFPHYDWEDESGDYFSDYRKWKKKRVGKRVVYTFLVRNQHTVNLANAPIKIELDGLQNVDFIKKDGKVTYIETTLEPEKRNEFTLVDVDNNKTYSYDELENANLTMDGSHKRTFRWVRGEVREKDFDPLPQPE